MGIYGQLFRMSLSKIELRMSSEEGIKKILVVDDEKMVANTIVTFLQSTGYDCKGIIDPAQTFELLERDDIDLVILDITMDAMDGLSLLDNIVTRNFKQDVIVMTGNTNNYVYGDIIKAGATDFIGKPFQMSELEARIDRIDRERIMRSELQELKTALRVLLTRREEDKDKFCGDIISNINELVSPFINKLKNSHLNADQKTHLEVLESNLFDICSPLIRSLSPQHVHLSSMEVQVANLIKSGKSNKEISSILGISLNTVLTHRYRLRSKLGLKGEKINLRSYLSSIDF